MEAIVLLKIVTVLLFSAFFSGLEIAFVSSNKLRLELDKAKQGVTSHVISLFYRHPNDFISTILVGNNISLVIYGILMAEVIGRVFFPTDSESWVALLSQTLISTLIVLVVSEFLPKTLFRINPNRALRLFAVPAFVCFVVLYPISKLASSVSKGVLKLMGVKMNKAKTEEAFKKVDLDHLIQTSIDNSSKDEEIEDEVKIFQNALDFSNIKIRDCIVPRTEINAVEVTTSLEVLKTRFIESGNSKILVFEDDIDHIIGYIHSSELFRHADTWVDHIQKVPIVPETMVAQKLMKIFMQQKKSLAVVVDEFGGTAGIVAMEDLVEEIFGDIEDEHDNAKYVAKMVGDDEYVLSARLEIEKVNELFSLYLPESDDYLTIGGLILHQLQSFPKLNEVVTFDNFEFKIIKNTTTKIELVRLKVNQ